MEHEDADVRIARIEEGVKALRSEVETNHAAVMTVLILRVTQIDDHEKSISVLKRDRYWMFLLVGGSFTFLCAAVSGGLHIFR